MAGERCDTRGNAAAHPRELIRIVLADGSPITRRRVRALLAAFTDIVIIGEARDSWTAIELTAQLRPDLAIIDLEMPGGRGDTVERIMGITPVPVLAVASRGESGAAFAALAQGALEVIGRRDLENPERLARRIRVLAGVKVITHIKGRSEVVNGVLHDPHLAGPICGVVAFASSTGGPQVLSLILSGLPASFPLPIVIAQHISDGFSSGMVSWLKGKLSLPISTAEEGAALTPGRIYVAPSEQNMEISPDGRTRLVKRRPDDIYRPSCNALLTSVADVFGSRVIGVILTGMGSDGVAGMQRIKGAGGVTIAQDEGSSLIFGMPRLAIETGCIDRVLPHSAIAEELMRLTTAGGPR